MVDSFRTVIRRAQTETAVADLQGFVQKLALHLTSWQATTFLIGEYDEGEMRDNPVFTVADGLFWLSQQIERNSIVRKLQIRKSRGQASVPGLAHLSHHRRRLAGFSAHFRPDRKRRKSQRRASSFDGNCKTLDEMMGGGIPEGDSVLVGGSSGTGKSLLGTTFIMEGLKHDEPGIVAMFEERPNRVLESRPELRFRFGNAAKRRQVEIALHSATRFIGGRNRARNH